MKADFLDPFTATSNLWDRFPHSRLDVLVADHDVLRRRTPADHVDPIVPGDRIGRTRDERIARALLQEVA